MKKVALFLGFFLLLVPSATQAATSSCSAQGYTVVYVNGVFDTEIQAKQNRKALADQLPFELNGQPLTVQLGYNPTHLAGAGDLVQSAAQLFNKSVSNFDLDTILLQIYPEVTTRKLLLVGHSQGAFYTNSMYDYLLSHGEPDSAVAVYNVASPAAYTAGHGKYINSSGDSLLALLRSAHFDILPNNVDLVPTGSDGDYSGHAFATDYLAGASTQMLADMDGEMNNLQATDASASTDCFTPPTVTLGYKATAAAFAVADPTATVLKAGTVTVVHASEVALNAATKVALGAVQLFSDSIIITAQPPTPAQTTNDTEKIINKLYGSSVDGLSPQDKKDLLGSSDGAAVVLAVTPPKAPAPKGLVLGTSTEVVDASTTLIVPKNIFPASANGPVWTSGGTSSGGSTPAPALVIDPVAVTTPVVIDAPADATTTPVDTPPALLDVVDLQNPSLVINEIEWAGDMFDHGREWIELKNRTAQDIDLTGYVIYAKSGGSQYISLSGTLPAYKDGLGFFVVERDAYAPLRNGTAQVFAFDQLDDSGEQLALARVDNTGTTTIDMTPTVAACNGWCAGSALADQGETLSMERVSADAAGTDPSNWASNDTFTVTPNMPTPAGQPWLANFLPLYANPLQENSLHLPRVGFYCNPDTYPIAPGSAYHPQTGQCTVMDRDIPYPGPLSAGVFKGVVGSSTQEGLLQGLFRTGKVGTITVDFSDALPGDQYFVAIWQPAFDASLGGGAVCTIPDDYVRMPSYFTTGHWLNRDGYCGGFSVDTTDVPETHFEYIPFTYQP
jgi:hypothetical protein